jgi:DNA modification methylase
MTMDDMFALMPELKHAKSLNAAISQAKSKAKTIIRKQEVQSNPAKYEETVKKVRCGPAEQIIKTLPDGFTKHILTDGPFGLDYGKTKTTTSAHSTYEDSPESYRLRTSIMAPEMYRVMDKDGFLIWFLAHDHFEFTRDLFRSVGFEVDPVPLMWNRSESKCYTQRPDKWFGKGYDIALHCLKGDPQMINRSRNRGKNGAGNVFTYKGIEPKDKEHIVERPIELYADLIQCISVEGEKITDFFGGSGKVAAACAGMKREHFTTELDPNHIPLIIQNIYANTPQGGNGAG